MHLTKYLFARFKTKVIPPFTTSSSVSVGFYTPAPGMALICPTSPTRRETIQAYCTMGKRVTSLTCHSLSKIPPEDDITNTLALYHGRHTAVPRCHGRCAMSIHLTSLCAVNAKDILPFMTSSSASVGSTAVCCVTEALIPAPGMPPNPLFAWAPLLPAWPSEISPVSC